MMSYTIHQHINSDKISNVHRSELERGAYIALICNHIRSKFDIFNLKILVNNIFTDYFARNSVCCNLLEYAYKQYVIRSIRIFQDNTPPRLAAMQHTWGVFSFIPYVKFLDR